MRAADGKELQSFGMTRRKAKEADFMDFEQELSMAKKTGNATRLGPTNSAACTRRLRHPTGLDQSQGSELHPRSLRRITDRTDG